MDCVELSLPGLTLLKPRIFEDPRGFFVETYRKPLFESCGIACTFVQDNHSFSRRGTLRGMHFQAGPGQDKLVTVMAGEIYDVAVDIRPDSATYGKWEGVVLSGRTHHQLYIPAGFAHGFCVLSEEAHVLYKVSAVYQPERERGFRYDDPEVGIAWPIRAPILSERDRRNLSWREAMACISGS
jgi:dTDP-4-dehydrorhamnose 3,5-epimerase